MQQQSNIDCYHHVGHTQTGARRATKWPAYKTISTIYTPDTAPLTFASRPMSV